MRRFVTQKLLEWKQSNRRKPLILRGARQVGKTYAVLDFAKKYYQNVVYLNFDQRVELAGLFAETKDPKRLLERLALASGEKITPGETLIFFDEVQECPEALNSLKYFCEEAPEYHIVSAGSLLGVRLAKTAFPVGKVDFLDMHPMTFSEFLLADGAENLVEVMKKAAKLRNTDASGEIVPLEQIFLGELEDKLRAYFLIGGMPEVVKAWVEERDIGRVKELQRAILDAYEQDFAKHTTRTEANKISVIWNGIPSQLARDNKKFLYQVAKTGARAREYEDALNWLRDAGLIWKVHNVTKPAIPLKAYVDLSAFKIYALDVGLLACMAELDSEAILGGKEMFVEAKGAFAENYCLNMLMATHHNSVLYYDFQQYSIDFITQMQGTVIPIEVKSGRIKNHASLTRYNELYKPMVAIRFSADNLRKDGMILNIPLAMVEYFDELAKSSINTGYLLK